MEKQKKIILLNGYPSTGKDYAAKYIYKTFPNVRIDKFARILKERTHALYGYPERKWDYYEFCKDIPNEDFYGLTPRQAYINVSEIYYKQVHEKDIFGLLLYNDLQKNNYPWDILTISDSGFIEEVNIFIKNYKPENIILIRIHRDGYTGENDSRNYLDINSISSQDIFNNGTEDFLDDIYNSVIQFLY